MTSITLRKVLVATAALAALSVAACGPKATPNTTATDANAMAPAADANAMAPAADNSTMNAAK